MTERTQIEFLKTAGKTIQAVMADTEDCVWLVTFTDGTFSVIDASRYPSLTQRIDDSLGFRDG